MASASDPQMGEWRVSTQIGPLVPAPVTACRHRVHNGPRAEARPIVGLIRCPKVAGDLFQ